MERGQIVYLQYFGLVRPPYRITPDTALFYGGAQRSDIFDALAYAVVSGEAITKVVGEVGSGKTMLCRMLAQRLPESVETVYFANPALQPEQVPHAIALELKLPVGPDDSRLQLMQRLQEHLLQRHSEGRQVVLLVEEAQGMSLETLEEIRLLSNLETERHKLLQVVLFGQPELDTALDDPRVRQIRERITNSFYLNPLSRREVGDYLGFRLHLAGSRAAPLFSGAAIWLINRLSAGLMRRINILADKALLAAYSRGSRRVTLRHVRAAAADCEFVRPARWWRPALALPVLALLAGVGLSGPLNMADATPAVAPVAAQNGVSAAPPALMAGGQPEAPAVVADGSLLQQRFEQSRRWLAEVAPEHFTIQLLWARPDGQQALERFLATVRQQREFEQIYAYREGGDGALGLLFGSFATYREAQAALQALPEAMKRYQPFLRNVRGVLAEAAPRLAAATE